MKIITKSIHSVKYGDFERLVKETYGVDYNFVADQECGNDSSHTFNGIDGKRDDDMEWDVERWARFVGGKHPTCMARDILNDLAGQGLIPTGDYVIGVSW